MIDVPAKDPKTIVINGIDALSSPELEFVEFIDSFAVFRTGNGKFEISTEL